MDSYFKQTQKALEELLRVALLDHAAFEQKIAPCVLHKCKATCCHDGVYLSETDATLVEQLASEKLTDVDFFNGKAPARYIEQVNEKKWKTHSRVAYPEELAEDFPSHFPRSRCTFLDEKNHCLLQKLSLEEKRHAWYYKPFTCWIHPISIQQRDGETWLTLVNSGNDPQKKPDYPGYGSCTHCGRGDEAGEPAHQVLEAELKHLGSLAKRDFLSEIRSPMANWVYKKD